MEALFCIIVIAMVAGAIGLVVLGLLCLGFAWCVDKLFDMLEGK